MFFRSGMFGCSTVIRMAHRKLIPGAYQAFPGAKRVHPNPFTSPILKGLI
jgi:hypothetical protein